MDEKQLEAQSRLLIELGEPETWLETMLRASRRSAIHEAAAGNEELAKRWRRLTRGLEYAVAATVHDPLTGEASTQSQMEQCELTQADRKAAMVQAQAFAGRQNVGTPASPIDETSNIARQHPNPIAGPEDTATQSHASQT